MGVDANQTRRVDGVAGALPTRVSAEPPPDGGVANCGTTRTNQESTFTCKVSSDISCDDEIEYEDVFIKFTIDRFFEWWSRRFLVLVLCVRGVQVQPTGWYSDNTSLIS